MNLKRQNNSKRLLSLMGFISLVLVCQPLCINAQCFSTTTTGMYDILIQQTGTITINAKGADGGPGSRGGKGGEVEAVFNVTDGDILRVIVGNNGGKVRGGGGGGGTAVINCGNPADCANGVLLMVAGGGGGGGEDFNSGKSATNVAGSGNGGTVQPGGGGINSGGVGNTPPSGGQAQLDTITLGGTGGQGFGSGGGYDGLNRGGGGGGGYTGGKGSASKQGVGFGGSNYINETHGSWVSTASNIGDGATGGGTNKDGAVTMTGGTGDCCGALRGMLISGNNQNIDDDDTTPALVDHTEFETALLGCQTVVRTFTIKNVGTVPLPVTAINITGAQASDFTVGGISLPTTLARHTSKTFTVTFNPSGGGLRTATIEINYDVCIDVFDFAIQGTGTGADMDVTGAGQSIADGDNSPALVDDTDFGDVPTNSNAVHNFTIKNLGISDLTIPVSAFVFMGPDPTKFSVGGIALPATISAGNMVNFTVTYTPGGTGMHTATLKIDNNDCNENPYNFDLKGNGFMPVPPKISVKGNGNTINNRAITVSTADDTDFGAVAVAGGMVTHTFTIENILNGLPLKLDGLPLIEIAGRDQTDFSVTQSTVNTLGSGGSTTFEVKFDPSAPGVRSAVIVITHNDLPENPFVFRVQGVGN